MPRLMMALRKKLIALCYFKQYYSVGYLRAIIDLRKLGLSEEEAHKIIWELKDEGLLRINMKLGVIDYIPKFEEFKAGESKEGLAEEPKEQGKGEEGPKSHLDWINDVLVQPNVDVAVKEALEEVREELESRERTYERIKSRLKVKEEELIEFLRSPKTAGEIYKRFGEDSLKLVQILRREGKVWLKKIDGVWRYGLA